MEALEPAPNLSRQQRADLGRVDLRVYGSWRIFVRVMDWLCERHCRRDDRGALLLDLTAPDVLEDLEAAASYVRIKRAAPW